MANTGDIVLIYREEKPLTFARIENIMADRKRDWYQVRLLILRIPLTETTWLLREEYINGEAFTMDGKPIRIEKITGMTRKGRPGVSSNDNDDDDGKSGPGDNKVISLFDRKSR